MKKTIILGCVLVFIIVGFGFGYDDYTPSEPPDDVIPPSCPVTKIVKNDKCMDCHAMRTDENGKPYFGLKPVKLDANYDVPYGVDLVKNATGGLTAYVYIDGTTSEKFRNAANFLYRYPDIKHVVIELMSPGGSVMDAWRSVGIMKEMHNRGITVETRCYGMAASAAAILLAAGDPGKRMVNSNAEIMVHKVWTFRMFDIKDPDTAEDQADMLKHFQKNINDFLVSRSNGKWTKENLEKCIFKRDFWITGQDAIELGLADGLIGN